MTETTVFHDNDGHIDVDAVRSVFPSLQRRINDHTLVYLDSAATAFKPQPVIDAVTQTMTSGIANVHRGAHTLAGEVTESYEAARSRVATFVGADPRGVVFTKNATEGFNLIAHALSDRLGPDDTVVYTQMEHHANMVPWQQAAERTSCNLAAVPITDDGHLDRTAFTRILDETNVAVLAVTAMSNVLGTINPVADLVEELRRRHPDAVVVVDGAQSVPHLPTDIKQLGADVLCFSGHKLGGPTGIGVVVADPELLDSLPPFLTGGEMIDDVQLFSSTFADAPSRFEAGTPPITQAVGLAAAIVFLDKIGMDQVRHHELGVVEYVLDRFEDLPGVTLFGPTEPSKRGAAFSFTVDGVHAHDVTQVLDAEGIAVRSGHHCARPLGRRLGVASTARASAFMYTTIAEFDALFNGIQTVQKFFGVTP